MDTKSQRGMDRGELLPSGHNATKYGMFESLLQAQVATIADKYDPVSLL